MRDRVGWSLALALGSLAWGCSSASRVAVGPTTSYLPNSQRAHGGQLLMRAAAGTSNGNGFPAFEVASRLLVNRRAQILGVGMGPAWFRSFGRGLLTVDATALLGGEVLDGSVLGMGTLHAAVGGGYAFSSTKSVLRRVPLPESNVGQPETQETITDKTALTLELTTAMDAPFTRAPQYSLGLLLGIAWVHERYTVSLPPLGLMFRPLQ
ncbi:MAG: hypothetical protein QM756_13955 [Polyangiaceae bacterium]